MNRIILHKLTLIWVAWSVILISYMQIVGLRYAPDRPDQVLSWTANETNRRSQLDKPFLLEPFLNTQVSMDSEFYLSIAVVGYEDTTMRFVEAGDGRQYPLNYAFYPLYPYTIRILALPLQILGMNPTATATLAGVLVSLLGTLAGMIALADMALRDDENNRLRSAFYLLIFPTSLYLSAVYTEGMFIGLTFSSLALMRRKHLVWASVLAFLATWTRAAGLVLIVPLAVTWFEIYLQSDRRRANIWISAILIAAPLLAHLMWRAVLGEPFFIVQAGWFGGGVLSIERSLQAWGAALQRATENHQSMIYYGLEVASILLAIATSVRLLRANPQAALFGLGMLALVLTSGNGSAQSISRYVLSVPAVFLVVGNWSHHDTFDRAWTIGGLLLLAMQAALFAFDMWVA